MALRSEKGKTYNLQFNNACTRDRWLHDKYTFKLLSSVLSLLCKISPLPLTYQHWLLTLCNAYTWLQIPNTLIWPSESQYKTTTITIDRSSFRVAFRVRISTHQCRQMAHRINIVHCSNVQNAWSKRSIFRCDTRLNQMWPMAYDITKSRHIHRNLVTFNWPFYLELLFEFPSVL